LLDARRVVDEAFFPDLDAFAAVDEALVGMAMV